MKRPRGPFGFVLTVIGCWIAGRAAVLMWTEQGLAEEAQSPGVAAVQTPRATLSAAKASAPAPLHRPTAAIFEPAKWPIGYAKAEAAPSAARLFPVAEPRSAAVPSSTPEPPRQSVAALPVSAPGSRVSGSAWALVRQGSGSSLAGGGGQLGGSQAGVRLRYALGSASLGLGLFGRLSAPLQQGQGREAAFGVEWRPLSELPVSVAAERRIGLDAGGRDAFALGLFGGVDRIALPADFRLDGYAQAGVVGLRRRDLYADGQLRVERPLASLGAVELAVGAGAWGGAQPGAARLDVGPQLVARLPLAGRTLRLNLDWRARVAGDAKPGSGVALTLAADF